jgi:tRNA(Ile)-lysidine synthase
LDLAKIALAHNRDDQAETLLFRLIRGSGLTGLSGMQPFREDGIIRPLLFVSRREIEQYCAENKLEYITDSTKRRVTTYVKLAL